MHQQTVLAGTASSSEAQKQLKVEASLEGLGPRFQARVTLTNTGEAPLQGLSIMTVCDASRLRVTQPLQVLPALWPNQPYATACLIEDLQPLPGPSGAQTSAVADAGGGADSAAGAVADINTNPRLVRCLICCDRSSLPMSTVHISVPTPELAGL